MRTVNVRINYRNGGSEIRSIRTDRNLTPEGITSALFSGTGTRIRSVEVVPATRRLAPSQIDREPIVRSYLD